MNDAESETPDAKSRICSWEGCERRIAWAVVTASGKELAPPMCSIHHPAGRAYIEHYRKVIEDIRDALERAGNAVDVSDLWPAWNDAHLLALDAVGVSFDV